MIASEKWEKVKFFKALKVSNLEAWKGSELKKRCKRKRESFVKSWEKAIVRKDASKSLIASDLRERKRETSWEAKVEKWRESVNDWLQAS